MRVASWLFLLLAIAVSAGVIWLFGRAAFDTPENQEASEVQHASAPLPQEQPLITFVDPQKGAEDGDVLIVEYGNHGCPFCRRAEEDIDKLIRAYPDRVRFVWKDLPSTLYPGSDLAAEAAQCAKDQGRFWEFHARLFDAQGIFNQTSLSLLANEAGLDHDRFSSCFVTRSKKPLIERNISEAEALNVDATPYFFINGERHSGQMTYEELEAIVTR